MFKLGDKVRRKKLSQTGLWPYGDKVCEIVYITTYNGLKFKHIGDIIRWDAGCFELVGSEYDLSPYQKWERSIKNETVTI